MFFNRPPEIIFLIGPQGSGKGTQGKKLAEEFGYAYWETGAILREEVKKQTVLGQKIAGAIEHGKLLPDEIIIQLLIDRLPGFKHHNIIFDGVTRKMAQTKFLLEYLKKLGYKRITAVVLDIPHDESVKRLVGRAKVEGRKDDTPEAISLRLSLYEKETLPALKYLTNHVKVLHIDGKPSVEEVYKILKKALKL